VDGRVVRVRATRAGAASRTATAFGLHTSQRLSSSPWMHSEVTR
jgi:hypothetical protein